MLRLPFSIPHLFGLLLLFLLCLLAREHAFLLCLLAREHAQAADGSARPPMPPRGSWDWQLSRPLDLSVNVAILDIDPDLITPAQARGLRKRGIYLVCYVSVGTWEKWRADAQRFPRSLLGKTYADWPDERFLDIRRVRRLLPLMRARFQRCRRMGFHAIEADNIDLHEQDTGFAITRRHVLAYATALARMAHAMGLAMAQKNAPDLAERLARVMDFAITEECFRQGWCAQMAPYLKRGRPVLDAEYADDPPELRRACRKARKLGISLILKTRALTRWRKACDAY